MSAEPRAAAPDEIDDDQPGGYFLSQPRRFCFVAGTHIATLRGEMPVDQLREGDHIRAKKGSFHTVKDVLIAAYDDLPPEAQAQIGLYPVKRGAVEEGLPRRDLYITAGQQFHLSRRLEIAHAVRMAVRKEGAALRGFRFVLFACPGLPMIRAEGIWTTLTPVERVFPMPQDAEQTKPAAEDPAPAALTVEPEPPAPQPTSAPAPRPTSVPVMSRSSEPAPRLVRPAPEPEPVERSEPPPVRRAAPVPASARPASEPAETAPPLLSPRPPAPEGARRAGRRPPTRFLRTPLTIPGVTDQTPEA